MTDESNSSKTEPQLTGTNEERLNSAIQAFDAFLQNLLSFEQFLETFEPSMRKQLLARVEHRVTSKLLEKRFSRTSASAILGRAVSSVQEIRDILQGNIPVPDAPNKPKDDSSQ